MPDVAERWREVRAEIRKRVTPVQYRTWFDGLHPSEWTDGRLVLVAPSRYKMDWLRRHFMETIGESCRVVSGETPSVELDYAPTHQQRRASESGPPHPAPQPVTGQFPVEELIPLNDQYRFDNFVIGPSNRLPHAAALAVSEAPAQSYNPLFLHGSVGLGKTHLMQAICHSLLQRNPAVRLHFVSCETFTNQFISAITRGDLDTFRNRYRHVDVLLIDDIHYLGDKERTQQEFFHTFNTLYNARKQIVLSSDRAPKEIPALEERLVSRFKWGLVTKLEPPEFETRVAILYKKARLRQLELDGEVASFIAENIQSNIRELEGAVNRISALARLQGVDHISLPFAQSCLRDLLEHAELISVGDIVNVVTREMDLRVVDLQSRKRHKTISYPRHICMYLAKKLTNHSLEEIGRHFGGRDHSTVVYAINAMTKKIKADEQTLVLVNRLEQQIVRNRRIR